ncbi:MAG TPA: prepilin-type N-terminal cleavage/methylation domain-containing protein [Blastocatellia bacterium]|nr:prepilin-type N-terminal cleavage/methylation domain-containing protein [Blastocatellia bacterium]
MNRENNENGFTLIEVAIASVISMVGLLFLASLFTLSISQNRLVKNFTATTALAQQKLEELNALPANFPRLAVGGNLNAGVKVGGINYFDKVSISDEGQVMVDDEIPAGYPVHYNRFWRIESETNALFPNTFIISVRVVSTQAGRNSGAAESTTLATVRAN